MTVPRTESARDAGGPLVRRARPGTFAWSAVRCTIRARPPRAPIAALLLALALIVPARATAANVAAASDLKFALEEIAERFRAESGQTIKLAFGSSGNLFQQILRGAPFEMFLSADEAFVDKLTAAGLTAHAGDLYAIGRLVLFAPRGSPLAVDARAEGLRRALAEGRIHRFAIANPEHAPYGRAAEEVLRHLGLWDALKGRLVLGENVSQAAQFATTGSAQGGIFAYSLVLAPGIADRGTHMLLPASWHRPLRQKMALLKSAGPTARAFYLHLRSDAARVVLRRYGFTLPGE